MRGRQAKAAAGMPKMPTVKSMAKMPKTPKTLAAATKPSARKPHAPGVTPAGIPTDMGLLKNTPFRGIR